MRKLLLICLLAFSLSVRSEESLKTWEESTHRVNVILLLSNMSQQMRLIALELKRIRCATEYPVRPDCYEDK